MFEFMWICQPIRGCDSDPGNDVFDPGNDQMIFRKPGLEMGFKLKLVSFTHPQ